MDDIKSKRPLTGCLAPLEVRSFHPTTSLSSLQHSAPRKGEFIVNADNHDDENTEEGRPDNNKTNSTSKAILSTAKLDSWTEYNTKRIESKNMQVNEGFYEHIETIDECQEYNCEESLEIQDEEESLAIFSSEDGDRKDFQEDFSSMEKKSILNNEASCSDHSKDVESGSEKNEDTSKQASNCSNLSLYSSETKQNNISSGAFEPPIPEMPLHRHGHFEDCDDIEYTEDLDWEEESVPSDD